MEIFDPLTQSFQLLPSVGLTSRAFHIALRFSKLLAPQSVNAGTIVLNSPEGRAYVKVVATENGRLVFVSPFEPLEPNTSYTLTIDRASDGVSSVIPTTITFTTAQAPKDKEPEQPNQPDWIPDENALRGDWTSKSPRSPWEDLPKLEAEAGVTALSGQTLTLRGQPLAHVMMSIPFVAGAGIEPTTFGL